MSLSINEVNDLINKIHEGDLISKETLVNENIPLVWSIVHRYKNTYYDKEDLVDKILEENYKKYEKNISIFILRYKTQNPNNLKVVLSNTISDVLDLLLEDIEFYRIIVMDPGLSGYLVKLKNGIKKLMSPEFNTSINQKIIYDFTFEGAFGVLTEWIKKDYASKVELIEVLTEVLSFGLQFSKI